MNAIDNTSSRIAIYTIDATRFSYMMMESSFNDMQKLLNTIKDYAITNDLALSIFKSAWQFVDMGYRFGGLLAQIRGLKHKEPRYKKVETALVDIEKARNFIQHLNSEIPKVSTETYPILGALSWSSNDKQKSFSLALGLLPTGTFIHSLSFDTMSKEFLDNIILSIDTYSVNLTKIYKSMRSGFEYFSGWVDENGYSAIKDIAPNLAVFTGADIDAMTKGAKTKRFLRVAIEKKT